MVKGKASMPKKDASISAAGPSSAAAPAAAAPAHAPASTLSLPHYLSTVSLQLIGLTFILSQSYARPQHGRTPSSFVAALIAQPTSVLASACVGTLIVQIYFGSWARNSRRAAMRRDSSKDGNKVKKVYKGFKGAMQDMKRNFLAGALTVPDAETVGEGLNKLDLSYLPGAAAVTLAFAAAFNLFAIALGAPVLTKVLPTCLLGLLLSLLSITPLALMIPHSEKHTWLRLLSLAPKGDLEIALTLPALGAILGSWLGALPMPLDSNESWQSWPTTSVLGMLSGYVAGSVVAVGVAAGRAIGGSSS